MWTEGATSISWWNYSCASYVICFESKTEKCFQQGVKHCIKNLEQQTNAEVQL